MTEDQKERAILFLLNATILLHEENLALMMAVSHSISDLDKVNEYTSRMQSLIDDLNGKQDDNAEK